MLDRAREFASEIQGPISRTVAECLLASAQIQVEQQCEEKAETLLIAAREVYIPIEGESGPEVLRIAGELAKVRIRCGNLGAARVELEALIAAQTEEYGELSLEVADSNVLLANVRLAQGQSNAAIRLLRSALGIFSRIKGRDSKRARETAATIEALVAGHGSTQKQVWMPTNTKSQKAKESNSGRGVL